MKIDIYTLLGMIKDGKAPKKIMYDGKIYEYQGDDYLYKDKHEYWLFSESYTDKRKWLDDFLNDEVEILETTITYKKDEQNDKIEYLDDFYKDDRFGYSIDLEKIRDKINEIIDHLNNQ